MLWIFRRRYKAGDHRRSQSELSPLRGRSPQSHCEHSSLSPYGALRCEAIPEELYYPNYQTDKDEYGQTPLMLWIEYRRRENIP